MKGPWWLEVSAPRNDGGEIVVDVKIRRLAQPYLLMREGLKMVVQFSWRDRPKALYIVLRTALMAQMHSFVVNFTKGGVA